MISLVTFADLQEVKYIASSVKNNSSWLQFVLEAETFDVKLWLGDQLLNELMTQSETSPESLSAENLVLLSGGSYLYQDKTYLFQGLKMCIIYYAFARFTNRSPFNYTAMGIVIKDSDLSTPVSDKIIQRLETESRLMGDAIREETIQYLNRNHSLYPLWTSSCTRNFQRRPTFQVLGD
jgi:hypothetical protein